MDEVKTYGRYPTLGEVCAYYSREDFLAFLLRTCAVRKVVLVIPSRRHWEPRWRRDRVQGSSQAELRQFILGRIESSFAGAPLDERLPYYPSFHQSLGRWPAGEVEKGRSLGTDGAVEADWPTWRECFQDLLALIDVLEQEGVPHHCKFSGCRSLHLLVPFAGERLRVRRFGESRAHGVKILRMPYSLNEDTGLVSLPLTREELATFRPWQANLHLAEIRDDWLTKPTPEERSRVREFVASLREREAVPRRAYFSPPDTLAERREQVTRRSGLAVALAEGRPGPTAQAWRRLWGAEAVRAEDLRAALEAPDPEAHWLTAEAFLLHGEGLTRDLLPRLLAEEDPYVRPAALDVMLRFPDLVQAYFVAAMQAEDMAGQARALHVLAQSDALRQKVLDALGAVTERTAALALRMACVTGMALGDWPGAWAIVRGAEAEHAHEPAWATRVEALRAMEDMAQQWSQRSLTRRAMALAALGREIADLLLLAVGTRERRFRRAFVAALSELADERALDVLVDALGDPYRDTVRWATRGLVKLGPLAVPPLLEAAASDQARLRRYAIRCLGHLADPRTHETVLAALEDADGQVCRQAALAVPSFATEADIERLKQVVHRCAEEVVESLLAFGEAGRQTVAALAVEQGEPYAARWLWHEGDERGRAILLAALDGPPEQRQAATLFLAERPDDERLVDVFIEGLSTIARWDRAPVARALARLRHPRGLDALIKMSKSRDRLDRRFAAEALGQWGEPQAVEALVDMLGEHHRRVWPTVARALVNLGESARPPLETAAADHPSRQTRRQAASVLQAMDLKRRLAGAEELDEALLDAIAQSGHHGLQLAAEWLRGRESQADIRALLAALRHENRVTRGYAGALLSHIGEPARCALVEFLSREPHGPARKAAEWVRESLGPERP